MTGLAEGRPSRRTRLDPIAWRGRGWEPGIWLLACAVHLLFVISLFTGTLDPLFNDSMHRAGRGCDFYAMYVAGYNAVHGESVFLPGSGAQVVPYYYPYRYLPLIGSLFGGLLTLVPAVWAYAFWLAICEGILALNVRATYLRAGRGVRGAALSAVWLTFSPYYLELWVGQFTFVLGSLLFWCVLKWEDGARRWAQGLWVVSVIWKPASLLWAPLWLTDRRAWGAVGFAGLLVLLDFSYFGIFPGDWSLFVETNVQPLPTWHAGNIGFSALLVELTEAGSSYARVRLAVTVALLLTAGWATWVVRRRIQGCTEEGPDGAWSAFWLLAALWTTLYFLVYKDVWEHHLTLILPFLILGLWRCPSTGLIVVTVLLAMPSPFVFYDLPELGRWIDPQEHFHPVVSLFHHSWRAAPLLALFGLWVKRAATWKHGVAPGR